MCGNDINIYLCCCIKLGQQSMFPNGQNQYGQQQFGQQCQMKDFMNMRGNDMFGYKNIQAFNFAVRNISYSPYLHL